MEHIGNFDAVWQLWWILREECIYSFTSNRLLLGTEVMAKLKSQLSVPLFEHFNQFNQLCE